MRNFKKIILLCVIFFLFESVLGFALEPVTFQHYLEVELERKAEENIQPDLAFFGNSRISTSFIPSIFIENIEDVELAFNGGTGSQSIAGTYYYLKDILEQHELKYAVVGIDYQTILKGERVLKRDLLVLERLKNPMIKAEFIADVFEPSEYIYFLKSFQYRNNVKDIPKNVKTKFSEEYRRGVYTGSGMVYENLGFTRETSVFGTMAGIYISQPWVEEKIDWKNMEYLDKIVEVCRKKGVQLFFVSTPLTISTVYGTPGYDECVEFFTHYAEEKGVPYDNLNLLIGREAFLPDSMMNCMEHIGADRAEIISDYYSKVLNARIQGENSEIYFFDSVEEMRKNMKDIVACAFRTEKIDESGNRRFFGEALGKTDIKPEFQFEIEKDGKIDVLQEYSHTQEVILPISKITYPMTLRVRCKSVRDDSEKMYEVVIDETTWE